MSWRGHVERKEQNKAKKGWGDDWRLAAVAVSREEPESLSNLVSEGQSQWVSVLTQNHLLRLLLAWRWRDTGLEEAALEPWSSHERKDKWCVCLDDSVQDKVTGKVTEEACYC